MTDIYVDGDACPVREEIYRVATRLRLNVLVVSNASRVFIPSRAREQMLLDVQNGARIAVHRPETACHPLTTRGTALYNGPRVATEIRRSVISRSLANRR